MSDPFIGEIRYFAGNFAPHDWMFCNGQLMDIAANDTLFNLIGTTYGGDGQQTFALPDLRGRLAIGQGTGAGLTPRAIGERGGTETVTLTLGQLPAHGHSAIVTAAAGSLPGPSAAAVPASPAGASSSFYTASGGGAFSVQKFLSAAIAPAGGGLAHGNMMPSVCVSFIISLFGVYPQQN